MSLHRRLTDHRSPTRRQHLRTTAATTTAVVLADYSFKARKQECFVVARVASKKQPSRQATHDEKRTRDIAGGSINSSVHDERSDSLRACFHVENLVATSFPSTTNSILQGYVSERQTSSPR